jgi:hypothetical protein
MVESNLPYYWMKHKNRHASTSVDCIVPMNTPDYSLVVAGLVNRFSVSPVSRSPLVPKILSRLVLLLKRLFIR